MLARVDSILPHCDHGVPSNIHNDHGSVQQWRLLPLPVERLL